MSVLVLGAAGMVGSAVVREAVRCNLEVHALVRPGTETSRLNRCLDSIALHWHDLNDGNALHDVLDEVAPNVIVQAAFPSISAPRDPTSRRHFLQGLDFTTSLLEAMRATEFDGRLVLPGSAMCYGPSATLHRVSDPLQPSSFRGAVKAAESLLGAQFARETNTAVTELRIFTAYGPWEQPDRLLPSLFAAALTGGRVRLTAGSHLRDWVYVEDVARAFIMAGERSTAGPEVFNVCSGQLYGTHEVARMVEAATGRALISHRIYHKADQYGDPSPRGIPSGRDDSFPWAPEYGLEAGLRAQWEWAQSEAGRAWLLPGSDHLVVEA